MQHHSATTITTPVMNSGTPRSTRVIVGACRAACKRLVFAALAPLALAAHAQDHGPAAITEAECREWVATLASPAMRGRATGTPEGRRAAELIAGEFERLGLHGAGTDRTYFQDFTVGADRPGRNVLGLLLGEDDAVVREVVIVSAHYDHLRPREGSVARDVIYPGADDNASGVAALLELAEAFVARPPRRSVLFAAWDAEENQMPAAPGGLQGSGHWVREPTIALPKIAAMLCMDMLSRDFLGVMDDTLYVVGTERSDALRAIVERVDPETELHLDPAGTDIVGPRSDHWHFFGRKVPYLFFSTSQHADYHTPRDTPERAKPAKLAACARAIEAIARAIADADARPAFRDEPYVGVEEVRTFVRVGERVLERRERFEFDAGAEERLGQILDRARAAVAAGAITAAERQALVMAAGALLMMQVRER